MASSFMSAADLAMVGKAREDLFATRWALAKPQFQIVLSRWNDTTQSWASEPPRDVIIKMESRMWPNTIERQAYTLTDEGAQEQTRNGVAETLEPWDVRVGDRFDLWDETPCIVFDVLPPQNGYQRAWFRRDQGGP